MVEAVRSSGKLRVLVVVFMGVMRTSVGPGHFSSSWVAFIELHPVRYFGEGAGLSTLGSKMSPVRFRAIRVNFAEISNCDSLDHFNFKVRCRSYL